MGKVVWTRQIPVTISCRAFFNLAFLKLPHLNFPFLILAVLCLVLSACTAPINWAKPNVTNDQKSVDYAECKRRSNKEINDDFKNASLDDMSSSGGRINSSAVLGARFKQHDARKKRQALLNSCLKRKGYHRVVNQGRR